MNLKYEIIIVAGLIVGAGGAQAQSDPPAQSNQSSQSNDSNQAAQEYQGPTILSRDKSLIGERGGKLLDFRFYGTVSAVYDTGLTPVLANPDGTVQHVSGQYGVQGGFGVIGSKIWKRDQLSLEYSGTYRDYPSYHYFSGFDQFLNLRYARILQHHMSLDIKETAGTTTLANGGFSYLPLTNTDLVAIPANDLFDSETKYSQTRVDLIYQVSPRLSFSLGGEGIIVRRSSIYLAGLNGFSAHADASYRLSLRQTVSVNYSYSNYDYQRLFGEAHIQSVSLGYSIGIGRRWDAGINLGGSYAYVHGLTQVDLDPAIAAIVGSNVATTIFSRTIVVPYGEARLLHRFSHSSLNFSASTGTNPGNGVYLTSRQNAIAAGYSYAGLRRWTVGFTAGYTELSALGQSLGKYTNYIGGVGTTYKIANATHLEFRYDYRHYTTQGAGYLKNSQRVTIGFAFSPGEKPLPIW